MPRKNKAIRAKLIANSTPGKASNAAKNLQLVTGYLKKSGLKVDVALVKSKEKATRIATRAIKNGYKIVIAMGGDSIVEAVIRGVSGSKAHLGIIPVGTENNIASSLGIPNDLEEACALIASDKIRKLDMGQVTNRKGEKFVFLERATIGFSAAISPDASKGTSGEVSSLKITAKTPIDQNTSQWVFLTIDGESKTRVETRLVMITNSPGSGEDLVLAPVACLQDGLLDISVYPGFSEIELREYFAELMNGGYSGDRVVQHYQARKLKVKTSPKLDVMAEGIVLGKGTARIKVLPGALRVIALEPGLGMEKPQEEEVEKLPEPVSPIMG